MSAERDIPALLASGDEHAALHAWVEAQDAYEAALAQDPANGEIHRRLGDLHYQTQDYARARHHYERALAAAPLWPEVHLALGDTCRAQDDAACATHAYDQVLALSSDRRSIARAKAGLAALAGTPHVRCKRCGRFSVLPSFKGYGSGHREICPRCYTTARTGRARFWWLWFVALIPIGLCFFGVLRMPWRTVVPAILNQILLLLVAYAMIPPHELAHAVTAWALGGRVYEIRIGVGPLVWERQIKGTIVSLRRYPAGGFTMLAFPRRERIQLRTLAATAAGVALSGLIVLALRPYYDPGSLVWDVAIVESLVIVNAILLLLNLIPRKLSLGWTQTYTDGGHILRILMGKSSAELHHLRYFLLEGQYAIKRRDFEYAVAVCRQGLRRYPDNAMLLNMLAVARLEAGETAQAGALFVEILTAWEADVDGAALGVGEHQRELLRAILLNNVAAAIVGGDVSASELRLAHEKSLHAYEIAPWHPAIESTWGSILVRLGFARQGLAYLSAALTGQEEDERSRAGTLAFMALAHHHLGHVDESAAHLSEARSLAHDHYDIRLVDRLLQEE